MRWRELEHPAALAALERVVRSWDGTPYREGSKAVKGMSADCVRFVGAVLDELRGKPPTPILTLRNDAAKHSFYQAVKILEGLLVAFAPVETVKDGTLEPGDVVALSYGGGPTHSAIVGWRRNTLWESTQPTVRMVGVSALERADTTVYHVYRPTDKATWK